MYTMLQRARLLSQPPQQDPFFSSVKLLAQFNGPDASTAFVDSSLSARTITANGNAQLDEGQKVFGPSSLLLDGTGDFASCASSSDFNMQTAGDWTIDCWIRANALTTTHTICQTLTGATGVHFSVSSAGLLSLDNSQVGSGLAAGTISIGVWHHVAAVRASGTTYLYIDGRQVDSEASQNYGDGDSTLTIGNAGPFFWNGWIDAFRVTKGVARYTASAFEIPRFPPPNRGM